MSEAANTPWPERPPHRIHLVGIGGIGLSAIARVLAMRGHAVSGSDMRDGPILGELARLGVTGHVGHAAEQIGDAELVVVSSAVPETNPEIQAARRAGIPVVKRQAFMGALMQGSRGVAVAGTHGKTTTSAMIAFALDCLGCSPTFIVGGILADLGTNARAGDGDCFVIEADEYDHMFHGLWPEIAVVTNIEMDHPDCYRDIDDMRSAFATFLDHVHPDGRIVACADSPQVRRLLRDGRGPGRASVVRYGLTDTADCAIGHVEANGRGGVDLTLRRDGAAWMPLSLSVPGAHNALNATAALLALEACGVRPEGAADALAGFSGVKRRFEIKGERAGVLVVDDYAHHPTEVRATLAAARLRYPGSRIWAVFQPHTYSRTETLMDEFSTCFADADEVLVTDIYAARSREAPTVSADDLVAAMDHSSARHLDTFDQVIAALFAGVRPGDLVLTMGAGDGYRIGERMLDRLEERATT